ncbi:MAG: hypothetical protein ACFBSF_21175 [Leptolyngbyaceae cyanobacterium]
MTFPGSPMIQNGQEFAEDHWLPEGDIFVGKEKAGRRVHPRPLRWDFANDVVGRALRGIYKKLNQIREDHPGLRSDNVYPRNWPDGQSTLNAEGYGVDRDRGLVIYHRYGDDSTGNLQRFIVVLNFSQRDASVSVPFSTNGRWKDLLSGDIVDVTGYRANILAASNWGRIYLEMLSSESTGLSGNR